MVKKRSSFAQHGPYLAIVAVVAVVAIVFLILNFAGVSPVGEAVRTPTKAPATPNVCVEGERCGFVSKDDLGGFVTKEDLKTIGFHSFAKNPDELTCDQMCLKLGYEMCIAHYTFNTFFVQGNTITVPTPIQCNTVSTANAFACRCV